MAGQEFEIPFEQPDVSARRWQKEPPGTMPTAGETVTTEFQQAPSHAEDIAKTAAAQATLGAADILAFPATVGEGVEWAQGKLGYGREEEAKSPEEKGGTRARFLGIPGTSWPTQKAAEEDIKSNLPNTEYDPVKPTTEYAGTASRFASSSIPGKLSTLPERVVSGVTSGVSSELASDVAEFANLDASTDAPARFVGAVIGGLAGPKAAGIVRWAAFGNSQAEAALAKALAEDMKDGTSKMSPDKIRQAMESGAEPSIFDMAGPKTEALLEKYAGKSPEARAILKQVSDETRERSQTVGVRMADYIKGKFNFASDAAGLQKAEQQAGQIARDAVYGIAKADPAAQNIAMSPKMLELSRSKTIQQIMKDVSNKATDPDSGIIVPSAVQKPQISAPFYGVSTAEAKAASGGNLVFWDQVKQDIDDKIGAALRSGERGEARRLTRLKNQLVSELDASVPSYANARDLASETFGAANAPMAGFNFMKNISIFESQDVADALRKMNPDQRKLFAQGAASALVDMVQTKGISSVASRMNKGIFADRMKLALGNDTFNELYGRIQSENLMSKIKNLQAVEEPAKRLNLTGSGALVGGLGSLGLQKVIEWISHGSLDVDKAILAGTGAVVGALGERGFSAREAAIGNKVLTLARSGKPEDVKKLAELAAKNTEVKTFLDKVGDVLEEATYAYARSMPPPAYETRVEDRGARASGGRTTSSAAEALLRDLKRRKVMMANKTEQMLSLPDDAVVQALEAAKR
jgi:hypothetical protein